MFHQKMTENVKKIQPIFEEKNDRNVDFLKNYFKESNLEDLTWKTIT